MSCWRQSTLRSTPKSQKGESHSLKYPANYEYELDTLRLWAYKRGKFPKHPSQAEALKREYTPD